MADWCKLYETDLDDYRFQAIVQKNHHVIAVWFWILTECTKSKSEFVSFDFNEFSLAGISWKLRIEVNQFQESLNLLDSIKFITLSSGGFVNNFWESRQSDYCRKKSALIRKQNNNVQIILEQSPTISDIVEIKSNLGEEKEEKEERGEKLPPQKINFSLIHNQIRFAFEQNGININPSTDKEYGKVKEFLSTCKDSPQQVLKYLSAGLKLSAFKEKLHSPFGLLNFLERYSLIKQATVCPTPQTFKPFDDVGVPCPKHLKAVTIKNTDQRRDKNMNNTS